MLDVTRTIAPFPCRGLTPRAFSGKAAVFLLCGPRHTQRTAPREWPDLASKNGRGGDRRVSALFSFSHSLLASPSLRTFSCFRDWMEAKTSHITQVPPALVPAGAPEAPAAPLVGDVPLILNALGALRTSTDLRMDALERRMERRMDNFQRDLAIIGNMGKGTGQSTPYSEVLFLDGSLPSVAVPVQPAQGGQPAVPGRPALPALTDVDQIRNLDFTQAGQYLTGHGIAPLPDATAARHRRIAQCVGCIATI
ncbi:hypothetical protein B0H17DRAFT_121942 [Mycena rosella]|uniref:Mug135-like C-terminal domain-containing protein n=1 Tax=Mycena rosella TaxID=1033263 RepID=A0AAD7D3M9_MYCRO|nr:hypothetical protein B0H17DRAFT_121942 [Mycena rosella]